MSLDISAMSYLGLELISAIKEKSLDSSAFPPPQLTIKFNNNQSYEPRQLDPLFARYKRMNSKYYCATQHNQLFTPTIM